MHVFEVHGVIDARGVIAGFGIGQADARVEDHLQRDLAAQLEKRIARQDILPLGRIQAVIGYLPHRERALCVGNGCAQVVDGLPFLLVEQCPLAGDAQLGVPHGGVFAAESQRHGILEAHLPFLKLARHQIR